jgi:F-type H+-transporting ATPase subunit b
MQLDAEFWVAIAFLMFAAILGNFGAHRSLFQALDRRSARIRHELNEAHGLRREAEALLRDSYRKREEIQEKVERIMDDARAEASRLISDAKVAAENFVQRHKRLAEAKIAQAEFDALAEIRSAVADAAVAAAEEILLQSTNPKDAGSLFTQGIEAVKEKLRNMDRQ